MLIKNHLFYLITFCNFSHSFGVWYVAKTSLGDFFSRFTRDATKCPAAIKKRNNTDGEEPPQRCDENQLMLQLATLYIVSPERIILLLTKGELKETCYDIKAVLKRISATLSYCHPLPATNLYVKLYDGLEHFYSSLCVSKVKADLRDLEEYQECCSELREELIECEGPPDWFERKNQTVVCQDFDDIINCYYIKAATLCGLKPALALRIFAAELISRVILFKCPVPTALPNIDEPLSSSTGLFFHLKHNYFLNGYSAILIFTLLYL